MTAGNDATLAIAVFAHNEAGNIVRCLDSVLDSLAGHTGTHRIHVLNNGSTDNSEAVIQAYATQHPAITQAVIQAGDKANAWNHFVHDMGVSADRYIFVDGDVTIDRGAIPALLAALSRQPHAHIATGVPGSGRNRALQLATLRSEGGVQGNLYAARGSFIQSLFERGIRMPFGFIREDGLIGAYAMYDLDPVHSHWDKTRIAIVEDALFRFPSLRWYSPHDIRLYWRRRKRYSLGWYQVMLLLPVIRKDGFEASPARVEALYPGLDAIKPGWRGTNTFFDWLVLRDLDRH